ncbi:hypothetical protein A3C89_02125 [Candidatus Kaiserbacteria bacterium RIFCSPHIGHO2_02_FULL_50_50]|uniref:Major facilitator superfamily (MFS) profile domain-containing protein n=1 Tax=Candidatus Kaiserbacteria bacterium RIFCSPHIGHO2_02_FULL_50_50 TaxID=1798492 RepID=A0A1F6DFL6_9BACT|nr:MAG: hypothetical protein A3C89_02125 [Candidatus Kaiserbacteria bacterium RIFCSPHIGHO2_02_FULL_50_50]OGG88598.1 MAG: hypothetical protein A3G62_00670 [Candidatus Kaiserbacteria bacterium RIFCSPLOWO2_12_FULL_50_10]
MQSLESNIWKYGIMLVANKRVFAAVLGAYYLTIPNVTAASVGTIMLFSSLAGFLFEIPSGYLSDKMGHKHALVLARVFFVASSLLYLLSENLLLLILASVAFALGGAFMSGTGSAFMHETLRALGKDDDYTRIMGKLSSLGFAIPVILTALVPFLVSVSFKLPFLVMLIIDIVALFVTLSLVSPKVSQEHIDEIGATNFKQVMREGIRLGFMPFAFFTGTLSGLLMIGGVFRTLYQVDLGLPVVWFGVLHGVGRLGASLMLAYSGKFRTFLPEKRFYSFEIILYAALFSLLGIITNMWIIATIFILLNAFQWGLTQIEKGYLLKHIGGSKFKATLLSVPAQLDALVVAAGSFIFGYAVTVFDYRITYLLLAIAFICIMLPLYARLRKELHKN